MILIEIETENAAFADDIGVEVARILHHLATQLASHAIDPGEDKDSAYPLMDANGNRVGGVWAVQA